MNLTDTPHDRRRFLHLAGVFSAGALLAGCGGGEEGGDDIAAPSPAATSAPIVVTGSHVLNLALNLAYLGAQFYGHAASGAGLPGDLTGGIGMAGAVSGARAASFQDPMIAGYAAELAVDKQAHVVALRRQIGTAAAAQPAMDLSGTGGGAFAVAAQGAGIVAAGAAFDPYASDGNFLLGALLVENAVAAAYRTLTVKGDEESAAIVAEHLADSIYHGGLIRTLLDDRAASDASIDRAVVGTTTLLAKLDGTDMGDQTLAGAVGVSSNLFDADGRPIPFTRDTAQVLKGLYLSTSGVGGFLPRGANGIAVV
ncbi:ferritin-like domain-containing protein [Microvirga sp. SRT01]|uniref:Ferritin-like domain-containing protein n=1 Tax=Sphingomonas longa TaxID=2778730 RepID=A0ABS2D973_9SPHN|nr:MULTISPECIES: ferritin-like domain-containing protein [Alphaproteobacteria]MBM6577485.1 ferritin-like domain-containing protein [Sphingomonas sp. BT552]MBR7710530.1 ferritin-like domain-containing protein [Microvirga sp. SRT01]